MSSKKKGFFLRRFFFPVQNKIFLVEMFILCKHERTVTLHYGFLGDAITRDNGTRDIKTGDWEERLPLTRVIVEENRINIDGDRLIFSDTLVSGTTLDRRASWHIELAQGEVMVGKHGGLHWLACMTSPQCSGSLIINGENYTLPGAGASLYWDSRWGDEWPQKWFFLCGMNLKSDMSHLQLENSFFLVQGVFGKKLSLAVKIGNECVAGDLQGNFNCTKVGTDVHWSVSIKHRGAIVDVDVTCEAETMSERCFDSPLSSKGLHLLCGIARENNADRAEIRILRPVAKTLELIEFAHSDCTIAECGNLL